MISNRMFLLALCGLASKSGTFLNFGWLTFGENCHD
jgi:hypothetical protein